MQAFWFVLIAVLWAGFFALEGFDFGVGILLPVVARSDIDRRIALRTIGPVWDGNEVWLIVAGGATFAAFPDWYASVFSGFYLAFVLLLAGLILRGIGIEYRGKAQTSSGVRWCDAAIVVGSLLPALLLGVAFADFLRGVRMDAAHNVTGGFFDLVTPYALSGGVVTLVLFALHGALFLTLRATGEVRDAARATARSLWPLATLATTAFVIWTLWVRGGALATVLSVVLIVLVAASGMAIRGGHTGLAFSATAAVTALLPMWVFSAMWPDVLPARNNSALSLTIHNASSSPYTLRVMMVVALIFTPLVLAYQAWTYWIFRARVTGSDVLGDGHGPASALLERARESARVTLGGAEGSRTEP